jgi:hypothetical protein
MAILVVAGCASDPAVGNECVGDWASPNATLSIEADGHFELVGLGEPSRGTASGCTGDRKELRLSAGTTFEVVSIYADGARLGWWNYQNVGEADGVVGRWRSEDLVRGPDRNGIEVETWAWGDLTLAADHTAMLGCDSQPNALCVDATPDPGSWDATADTVTFTVSGDRQVCPIFADGTFAPLVFDRAD